MPVDLTKTHLKYMNIGERYWESALADLNQSQEKSLRSFLNKLEATIDRGIGLFLWGPNNTGKSYVSALLCKLVWAQYRVTSYCVTAAELKESWIKSIPAHSGSDELMVDRVMTARYLVIDDLGKEYRSDSGFAETNFGVLLRQRSRMKRVTNITSNLTPKEFGEVYGKSTAQLVKECMYPVHFDGPDMREQESQKITQFINS